MVNNLTFMGFTILGAFMLVYAMAVYEHNHVAHAGKKVSVGAFIDKKVAEFDAGRDTAGTHGAQKTLSAHTIAKVNYTNNDQKLAYLWGDAK